MTRVLVLIAFAAMASPAMAGLLSGYTVIGNYSISQTSEASGITYNRDTGTLFAVGDEGHGVEQYTLTGQYINSMQLDTAGPRESRAADDPEGIAYLGNGKFMIADERDFMGRVTTYEAGVNRTLTQLAPTSYDFDPINDYPDSNTGLEGVAYDPITGGVWGVRESGPSNFYFMDGIGGTISEPISLRNITRLGLMNFSDIFVMANSNAFDINDPRRLNLLLLSRYSGKLVEITRAGVIVDELNVASLGAPEGLTMDDMGNIYIASEMGGLFVLSAVPEPSTYALLALGGLGLYAFLRRQRKLAA